MLERCRRGRASGVVAGLLLSSVACSDAETRPARIGDCNDPACLDARDLPQPSVPSTGVSGGGAGGTAGEGGGSTLAGNVLEVAADLLGTDGLGGVVEVRAPNATLDADEIAGETGPGGTYRIDGVRQGAVVWVAVGAFESPPVEPYMDTLQAVDTTQGVVDLRVMRRQVMRDLASTFLLEPVELDPELAAILIRFVDERGAPLAGVRITIPDPAQVSTAYDAGDTYSDALDATSVRGTAVLLNLPAARYPGGATSITADIDGEPLTANLLIAQGAVTVVTAVVPDP